MLLSVFCMRSSKWPRRIRLQFLQQFGIRLQKVGETTIVASAGMVLGPQAGSPNGGRDQNRLLAVGDNQLDFSVVAQSHGPKPKIIIGWRQSEKGVCVKSIGMEAMGGIKSPITSKLRVAERGDGIARIPFPCTKWLGKPTGVQNDSANSPGMDVFGVTQPRLIKGFQPIARVVQVIIRRYNESLGPFAERREELGAGFHVFAPSDFKSESLQCQQIGGKIVFAVGEFVIAEPENEAVGLEGLLEEGVDSVLDKVDAGGEGGEGDDEFVFIAGGRVGSGFAGLEAIPRPIVELYLLTVGLAQACDRWIARKDAVDSFEEAMCGIKHGKSVLRFGRI